MPTFAATSRSDSPSSPCRSKALQAAARILSRVAMYTVYTSRTGTASPARGRPQAAGAAPARGRHALEDSGLQAVDIELSRGARRAVRAASIVATRPDVHLAVG